MVKEWEANETNGTLYVSSFGTGECAIIGYFHIIHRDEETHRPHSSHQTSSGFLYRYVSYVSYAQIVSNSWRNF